MSVFSTIGTNTTAVICKKAIGVFGREIPADSDECEEMLEKLESDEIEEVLEVCDNAFFDYEDDLNELNYRYAVKHREYFT